SSLPEAVVPEWQDEPKQFAAKILPLIHVKSEWVVASMQTCAVETLHVRPDVLASTLAWSRSTLHAVVSRAARSTARIARNLSQAIERGAFDWLGHRRRGREVVERTDR